ncbi:FBD-associated F-box protein At5g38590-like [Bidens hawaiensis]|uniref:FBD-associated F-box protein At5g38590-like n=1 Tax=Bidens hawaiensis TaxID=980011 RepID=UPI00404ADF27
MTIYPEFWSKKSKPPLKDLKSNFFINFTSALAALGRHGESKSKTSITNLPYEILLMILSLLSVKDAVATSCACKHWRFLWCQLTDLNFFSNVNFYPRHAKQIEQVDSVIRRHTHPVIHRFRINFRTSFFTPEIIDEWLQFAVNKKVEILDLDMQTNILVITLSNARLAELVYLKKLYLTDVVVRDADLEVLLKRSPHLESISIDGSRFLTHIRVGGRRLNLKHFKITFCLDLESLYLSDFDLESFIYDGHRMDLRLATLKEANISGLFGLEDVFSKLSSSYSSLQDVTFDIYGPKTTKLHNIPQLPNVRVLTLIITAEKDYSLLDFVSIAGHSTKKKNTIGLNLQLRWFSPNKSRRKARRVATDHPLQNLKFFKILRYYSRSSDLELVSYVIDHAAALKKLVIDTRVPVGYVFAPPKDMEKKARSSAKRQLKRIIPLKPPGVKLVVL